MSDHPIREEDLTGNPMAGYKSVDRPQPKHCKTMMMPAYTPDQARQRDGGSKALAPTEEMEAQPPAIPPLTITNIVQEICEVNISAWLKLPQDVRDAMLATPHKFRFYRNSKLPDIIFNGLRFHFEGEGWCLHSIVEVK